MTGSSIPAVVAKELDRLNPERIVVLGGSGVIGNAVATQLGKYADAPISPRIKIVDSDITTSTRWSTNEAEYFVVTRPIEVAQGATLQIERGVVVAASEIRVQGQVKMLGHAEQAVTVTDLGSLLPSLGLSDIYATGQPHLAVGKTGSVSVEFARILNAPRFLESEFGGAASIRITDSFIDPGPNAESWADLNVWASQVMIARNTINMSLVIQGGGVGPDAPVVERNTIAAVGDSNDLVLPRVDAGNVSDLTRIDLEGDGTNVLLGTPLNRLVRVVGGIPEGGQYRLSADSGASAFQGQLGVAGTLSIDPGIVLKGMNLGVTGTLNAIGTPEQPIIFTNDGGVGHSRIDARKTGSVSVEFARILNAPRFLESEFGGAASIRITDSFIDPGPNAESWADLNVWASQVMIARNTINMSLVIQGGGVGPDAPVVERNTIAAVGDSNDLVLPRVDAGNVSDLTRIDLEGDGTNVLLGTPLNRLVRVVGGIPEGGQYRLSADSGASAFQGQLGVAGTLSIDPGIVLKGMNLGVTGTLNAIGTPEQPIIFTRSDDDALGGDTDGEGTSGQPSRFRPGGRVNIEHVVITPNAEFFDTYWRGAESFRIVDSEISAPLLIVGVDAPILVRNVIAAPAEAGGVRFSEVADISGVPFSGEDANVLLGSPRERAVSFYRSSLAAGAAYVMAESSTVSAYTGELSVAGTLSIEPGVVVKGGLAVSGVLYATGTVEKPIVFTSSADDAFGGDTDGVDAGAEPTAFAISMGSGAIGSWIDHAVFKNSHSAIHLGSLSALIVTNSKFISNQAAVTASDPGSYDPTIESGWGELPCAPPFDSTVTMENVWFGETRWPGVPLGTETEIVSGQFDNAVLKGLFDVMTLAYQDSFDVAIGDNTIPWKMYHCAVGNVPVSFPVTPVRLNTGQMLLMSEPWVEYRQAP
ncbi:hypothetical protein GCM10009747_05170 [Agromyces humatus]|uniref:Uncharacterized protein n=1 Tax=Agromyces humatus TaxID=279573 RepID=A0ABN2K8U4_9MICO